ncbi:hypothetical protein GOB27_19505 [Sinorhizobium meliloti]|nr:hypothetical protein [Sinorhizobium meliloti]
MGGQRDEREAKSRKISTGASMRFSIDRDLILSLARIFFGTGLGKVGGSVALIGASSASGLLPWAVYSASRNLLGWDIPPSDAPLWFGVFLVLAGLGTAIVGAHWQRAAPQQPAESAVRPHDINLYRRFRAVVSDNEVRFLEDFDFGNPFDMRYIKGVLELADGWRGSRYEFSVSNLEDRFKEVKQSAGRFADAVARHVHHVRGNPDWGTTKPDNFDGTYSPALRAANKELNDRATELHSAIGDFERLASPELSER